MKKLKITRRPRTAKERKAVAVAKDVLKQLAARTIVSTPGIYLSVLGRNDLPTADLQKLVKQHKRRCEVCAIGAAVVSKARLYDAVHLEDCSFDGFKNISTRMGGDESYDAMSDIFDAGELSVLENAFEQMHEHSNDCIAHIDAPRTRLRLIYENVIRHGGHYVVEPPRRRV